METIFIVTITLFIKGGKYFVRIEEKCGEYATTKKKNVTALFGFAGVQADRFNAEQTDEEKKTTPQRVLLEWFRDRAASKMTSLCLSPLVKSGTTFNFQVKTVDKTAEPPKKEPEKEEDKTEFGDETKLN